MRDVERADHLLGVIGGFSAASPARRRWSSGRPPCRGPRWSAGSGREPPERDAGQLHRVRRVFKPLVVGHVDTVGVAEESRMLSANSMTSGSFEVGSSSGGRMSRRASSRIACSVPATTRLRCARGASAAGWQFSRPRVRWTDRRRGLGDTRGMRRRGRRASAWWRAALSIARSSAMRQSTARDPPAVRAGRIRRHSSPRRGRRTPPRGAPGEQHGDGDRRATALPARPANHRVAVGAVAPEAAAAPMRSARAVDPATRGGSATAPAACTAPARVSATRAGPARATAGARRRRGCAHTGAAGGKSAAHDGPPPAPGSVRCQADRNAGERPDGLPSTRAPDGLFGPRTRVERLRRRPRHRR